MEIRDYVTDLPLASGETLDGAKLVYAVWGRPNAACDNIVLFPRRFGGTHEQNAFLIGEGRALDPDRYCIITPNMLGNGVSSSPSNRSPAGHVMTIDHADNIALQARMLEAHFEAPPIELAVGWSMGAQQACRWAVHEPERVKRLLMICGTARTTPHNRVFLESLLAALAQAFREQVMRRLPATARRRFWEDALEGDVADRAYAGDFDGAADRLQEQIDTNACVADQPCRSVCSHPERCLDKRTGEVWLVGAGPGDPDLLTNKALRLMQRCDVVLHDRLVPDAILDRIRRDAEIIPVGKAPGGKGFSQDRINQMMSERAQAGDRVLRLKCGDPMIFGRGGEERDALIEAGIPLTVVPGVTAGIAAASEAGIALTDRRIARQCLITHGQALAEMDVADLAALRRQRSTLVVYMARPWLAAIKARLLEAGFSPNTPAALATSATRPEADQAQVTIEHMPSGMGGHDQPMLLVIGETAGAVMRGHVSEDQLAALPLMDGGNPLHGHH